MLVFALALFLGPTPAEEPLALPRTFDRVWYRAETKGDLGGKREGDLRITTEGLELSSNKEELVVPYDTMRMISYGPLGSDLDTEWVVIGLEREGVRSRLGLHDGSKMGYGGRTPDIYDIVKRVARERSLAQYAAPPGFVPYVRLDRQVTLAVPESYHALQHGIVVLRESNVTGTVVFSPGVPGDSVGTRELDDAARAQLIRGVDQALEPTWVLAITEAKSGMRCSGIGDKGAADLQAWIAVHELLGRNLVGPARLEPAPLDRCTGVRGTWRGAVAGPDQILVDVRAASDDEFVYVFALRVRAGREAEVREPFERGVGALHFAVARKRPKGAL
jgi:hypothetical protein